MKSILHTVLFEVYYMFIKYTSYSLAEDHLREIAFFEVSGF